MGPFERAFRSAIQSSLDPDTLAQLRHAARTVAYTPPAAISAIWATGKLASEHHAAYRAVALDLAGRYGLSVEFAEDGSCAVRFSRRATTLR